MGWKAATQSKRRFNKPQIVGGEKNRREFPW
jgi:hypothetical protein